MENNIRNIRKSHPDKSLRSGSRVAELMGISPSYYYSLETGKDGKRLNIEHIEKLAKIFGVTPGDLLTENIIIDGFDNVDERLKELLLNKENAPYLILSAKAREKGLSPETLEQLINLYGGSDKK